MWIIIGFAALGLLIGNLVGLTSESVVSPLVSLLFVFVGGSVLAVLHKLQERDRVLAGASIFCLSLLCLVGVYTGILVNQHRLLSPARARPTEMTGSLSPTSSPTSPSEAYLRSAYVGQANYIDREKQEGRITVEEAYERMYKLAIEYGQASKNLANK